MAKEYDDMTGLRLDSRTKRKLDQVAESEGQSKSELIRSLIEEFLGEKDEEYLQSKLLERVIEVASNDPAYDDINDLEEYFGEKSAAWLQGWLEQTRELQEKFGIGGDSKEDTSRQAVKQTGLQSKYEENFGLLADKIAAHAKELQADGVIPQDVDISYEPNVKRWVNANKSKLRSDEIEKKLQRLG